MLEGKWMGSVILQNVSIMQLLLSIKTHHCKLKATICEKSDAMGKQVRLIRRLSLVNGAPRSHSERIPAQGHMEF